MSKRSQPIKTKIVALLLVPLFSLVALWVFAARVTLSDTLILLNGKTLGDYAFSGEELLNRLEDERRATLTYVGAPRRGDRARMDALRAETNKAADAFRAYSRDGGVQGAAKPETKRWINVALRELDTLGDLRARVDADQSALVATLDTYSEIILPLARIPGSMSAGVGSPEIAKEANTLGAMLVAREILDREYALLSGALADGRLATEEYAKFVQLVGTSRYVYAQVLPDMRPEDQRRYRQIADTPAFHRVQRMENRVVAKGNVEGPGPVDLHAWQGASSAVMDDLTAMGQASGQATIDRTLPIILRILLQLAFAGFLGLVAVILSIVLSARIGRGIVGDLTGLREAARELAEERLPRVVERLHRGGSAEDVHEDAQPRLPAFGTVEIGEVGTAFSAVQRTAVAEAVNETRMRAGIRDVFVNLARRSQTLLSRQLKMLDAMERKTEDPDALDELFRLDHLATRMQRHAEGLIILSGSAPGRRWREPVPMLDVVRASVAEVEGYARVEVLPVTPRLVSLAGPVVADIIHLLAELIENATLFSPPNTEVRVYPQVVSNGLVVEIEDRGLGMSDEDFAAANELVANPPEFDLSQTARLGLFVVGQLARRHGIKVSLRGSPYGGTTAIVLLPPELVVDPDMDTGMDTDRDKGRDNGRDGLLAGSTAGAAAGSGDSSDGHRADHQAGPAQSRPRLESATEPPESTEPTEPSEPAADQPPLSSQPVGVATGPAGATGASGATGPSGTQGQSALPRRVRQGSRGSDQGKDGESR